MANDRQRGFSRRDFLRGAVTAAGGAAATGAAAGALGGCAGLPRVKRGAAPSRHPCDHRFCRYWRPTPEGEQGPGRCALAVRELGGRP